MSLDLKTKKVIPLTLSTTNVRQTRTSPLLQGSIILSIEEGSDINLGLIPVTGTLPVKKDIQAQFAYTKQTLQKTLESFNQKKPAPAATHIAKIKKSLESYRLLSRRVDDFFYDDPLYQIIAAEQDLWEYRQYEAEVNKQRRWRASRSYKKALIDPLTYIKQKIRQRIRSGSFYHKVLLDMEALSASRRRRAALRSISGANLFKTNKRTSYLRQALQKAAGDEQFAGDEQLIASLKHRLALEYGYSYGASKQADNMSMLLQDILANHRNYYKYTDVMFEYAKLNEKGLIADELISLFIGKQALEDYVYDIKGQKLISEEEYEQKFARLKLTAPPSPGSKPDPTSTPTPEKKQAPPETFKPETLTRESFKKFFILFNELNEEAEVFPWPAPVDTDIKVSSVALKEANRSRNKKIQTRAGKRIYAQIKRLLKTNQVETKKLLLKNYSKNFPLVAALVKLASAEDLLTRKKYQQALQDIAKISVEEAPYFNFLKKAYWAKALEAASVDQETKNKTNTISSLKETLRSYPIDSLSNVNEPPVPAGAPVPDRVKITAIVDETMNRLIQINLRQARAHRRKLDYNRAVLFYQELGSVLFLSYFKKVKGRKINRGYVRDKISEYLSEMNGLATSGSPGLPGTRGSSHIFKSIHKFYERVVPLAKNYLLYDLVFVRAQFFLTHAVRLHSRYEKEGMTNQKKKEVLKILKQTEQDLKWIRFAKPSFAQASIMLGWLYQFIDEKREAIIDARENIRDKDKFDDVYDKYFPRYLLEENLGLYQRNILELTSKELTSKELTPNTRDRKRKGQASNPVLLSFYLNLGNNYFLLRNFFKAQENYEEVLKGPNFRLIFESRKQEALFYKNVGKTYFFTDRYKQASRYLRRSLSFYLPVRSTSRRSTSKTAKMTKKIQRQREHILRYLALCHSLNNNNKASAAYLNQALAEQTQVGGSSR